jgi:DNA polymerase-3 subunit alpha
MGGARAGAGSSSGGAARSGGGSAGPAQRSAPATPGSGGHSRSAGAAAPHARAAGRPPQAGSGPQRQPEPVKPAAPAKEERVFVKIAADKEHAFILAKLKEILLAYTGPLQVVLYYENGQKLFSLSEQFHVKPSRELFKRIEYLLGAESVKLK